MVIKPKNDPNEPVLRSFGIEDLTVADEGNIIEGHPAVYGLKTNIGGYFYEVIERGAFDKCDFDDVRFTAGHDLQRPVLARSRRNTGTSTMHLSLDDVGVKIRAELDTENNSDAKGLYSAIKRGDVDGMSFIFYVRGEEWDDLDTDMPTRRITDIKKVIEVSAVNFPAYPQTDVSVRDQQSLDNARRALDNARSQQLDSSRALVEALRLKISIMERLVNPND